MPGSRRQSEKLPMWGTRPDTADAPGPRDPMVFDSDTTPLPAHLFTVPFAPRHLSRSLTSLVPCAHFLAWNKLPLPRRCDRTTRPRLLRYRQTLRPQR